MSTRVVVIDDDEVLLRGLQRIIQRAGFGVDVFSDAREALRHVRARRVDLFLVDLSMPIMDGIEFLEQLRADGHGTAAIMMSGAGTIQAAVKATQLGASDFLEKPVRPERLLVSVRNALRYHRLAEAHERLLSQTSASSKIRGKTPVIQELRRTIDRIAPTEGRVLILGENGTGKELVAAAIHAGSRRANAPYVKVNCAAVPKDLIESEIFGHERGAFTGATKRHKGRFEQADTGTLLLDEVGDMPLDMQAKLLRVLEDGRFERVGGTETVRVDVRVLAATNQDLRGMVDDGRFRDDLFYRLEVVRVVVPALRERLDDVPELAQFFLEEATRRNARAGLGMDDSARAALMEYEYPGNVRELRNVVERLVIFADGPTVTVRDVRAALATHRRAPRRGPEPGSGAPPAVAGPASLDELEKQQLIAALTRTNGKKTEAAEELGISRTTLWRRLKKHKLV